MRITKIDVFNNSKITAIEVIFVDFLEKPTDSNQYDKRTKYVSAELLHVIEIKLRCEDMTLFWENKK